MGSFLDAKSPVPSPPVPDHILWIAALLVTVVVSGMVFLTLKKRKKKQPGPSNECGESVLVLSADCHFAAVSRSAAFWSSLAEPRLAKSQQVFGGKDSPRVGSPYRWE